MRRSLLLALLGLALAGGLAWHELERPLLPAGATAEVRVFAGSSTRAVARQLRAAGVPVNTAEFVVVATITRTTRSLRAGRYRITDAANILQIVDKFRRGEVEPEQLTVVEGISFADLRAAIAHCPDLRHETSTWTEAELLHALGAAEEHAEGLFAPDTYSFDPGSSDLDLYRQAYRAQHDRLAQAWQSRAQGLPYAAPYEALIMASIIEKETGRPEERRQVASVFVNRQRIGMALQTDPTVIYGLGARYDGHLHKRDLQTDTPYNTYLRAGLPPTPISLPGRASIEAALNPDPGKALYFVARGDGSSEFSTNLADHNRAVDRYQHPAARGGAH